MADLPKEIFVKRNDDDDFLEAFENAASHVDASDNEKVRVGVYTFSHFVDVSTETIIKTVK